jgi:uncharacterized lipoprotein YmbA
MLLGYILLGSCAAPPLKLYTLETPATAAAARPPGRASIIVAVARVTIPDSLDTEDIVVREGSTLRRSGLGRWASRLSVSITGRLTQRLGERYPRALVTDRPLTETPSDRVLINIGRLDITDAGVATLDADWLVLPHDAATPPRRERAHFTATGPVASDQEVVTLLGTVLDRLAGAIDLHLH